MNLQRRSRKQLEEVNEVGPKSGGEALGVFSEPANRQLIKKLEKAGVRPTAEKTKVKSNKFGREVVCVYRRIGESFAGRGGERL